MKNRIPSLHELKLKDKKRGILDDPFKKPYSFSKYWTVIPLSNNINNLGNSETII